MGPLGVENGVAIWGPGGWRAAVSGPITIVVLTILAGFSGLAYINYTGLTIIQAGFERQAALAAGLNKGREDAVAGLHRDHAQLTSELEIQSYLLALPERDRPRLLPPPGLRERLAPR